MEAVTAIIGDLVLGNGSYSKSQIESLLRPFDVVPEGDTLTTEAICVGRVATAWVNDDIAAVSESYVESRFFHTNLVEPRKWDLLGIAFQKYAEVDEKDGVMKLNSSILFDFLFTVDVITNENRDGEIVELAVPNPDQKVTVTIRRGMKAGELAYDNLGRPIHNVRAFQVHKPKRLAKRSLFSDPVSETDDAPEVEKEEAKETEKETA